jgi:ATP-binding cassette subfamily B protein RaxB
MVNHMRFFHRCRRTTPPLILQTEAAECGLTALAMVAGYHGYHVDLRLLRQTYPGSLKGMSLADMIRIADHIGLASRALRLEPEEMTQLKTPGILHWNLNHFVVLVSVEADGITLLDPACGKRRISWKQVGRSFSGIALELRPTPGFCRQKAPQQLPWRTLFGGIDGLYPALAQIFILALLLELLALLLPLFSQWMIDGVLFSADQDMLKVLVIGFLLVITCQTTLGATRSWAVLQLGTHLGIQAATRIFTHLLRLPLDWFEKRFIGDIASRFHGASTVQQTLSHYFIEALLDGMLAIGTMCLMLVYSPALTLLALLGLLAYALLRYVCYGYLREINEQQQVLSARQESHFFETLHGIQAIKLFQSQSTRRATWLNLLVEHANCTIRAGKAGMIYQAIRTWLLGLEQAALLWFGASLVLEQYFSLGMYIAFYALSTQFSSRTASLIDKAVSLKMLRIYLNRLADILEATPELPRTDTTVPLDMAIEFRRVSFRHDRFSPWICHQLSFTVRHGESVALTGPSGCGKTTILKLILGIYTAEEGEIRIGNVPLSKLGAEGSRALCACVMQDDQLFAGSIMDNIAFSDPQADQRRIESCARTAAIHDDIVAMPMGYQSLIGEMGSALSGGQRQRILLARALYKQAGILLLDEATSHLDVALERRINQQLARLQLTRLLVAHRPETILSAERIIELSAPAS